MQNLIKINLTLNLRSNLFRVILRKKCGIKIRPNVFTIWDNKANNKRLKEMCKMTLQLKILIKTLPLPLKFRVLVAERGILLIYTNIHQGVRKIINNNFQKYENIPCNSSSSGILNILMKPPSIFILTVPRRYFCCGSLLLLVLDVCIYTLVQLLC